MSTAGEQTSPRRLWRRELRNRPRTLPHLRFKAAREHHIVDPTWTTTKASLVMLTWTVNLLFGWGFWRAAHARGKPGDSEWQNNLESIWKSNLERTGPATWEEFAWWGGIITALSCHTRLPAGAGGGRGDKGRNRGRKGGKKAGTKGEGREGERKEVGGRGRERGKGGRGFGPECLMRSPPTCAPWTCYAGQHSTSRPRSSRCWWLAHLGGSWSLEQRPQCL